MTQADQLPDRTQIHSWGMLRDLLKTEGCVEREQAATLASGATTTTYVNVPGVLYTGTRTNVAAVTLLSWIQANGILPNTITAFGGPQFGAACLSITVASLGVLAGGFQFKWFSVRPEPKPHGLHQLIDGAPLGPNDRVVLVDDVINTGASLQDAYLKVIATGAEVVAVIPLVDRSGRGASLFRDGYGVLYRPLFMYHDLDLQPL